MKKTVIFALLVLISSVGSYAQVTVGSDVSPQTTLDIIGDTANVHGDAFRLIDGNQGAGKILVSDDNGVGTWKQLLPTPDPATMLHGTWRLTEKDTIQDTNMNIVPIWASITLPPGSYYIYYRLHFLIAKFTVYDGSETATFPGGIVTEAYKTPKYVRTVVSTTDIENQFVLNDAVFGSYMFSNSINGADTENFSMFLYTNSGTTPVTLYLRGQVDRADFTRSAYAVENYFYALPITIP